MEAVRHVGSGTPLEEHALRPLIGAGKGFYLLVTVLLLIIGLGVFAYVTQLRDGLYVTGMRDRVTWGLYIALFVFFIGASMGGTFISAVLRVTSVPWRTPITRAAELVTVSALIMAAVFILFDMGRPDRFLNLFLFGRWESPLIWDVYGLATYLVGSVIYLYAALVPDLAICRDQLGPLVSAPKRWFFDNFAIGWQGTPRQHRSLRRVLTLMMILIIPVAVMMHTVTSWIFAMTLREPWDSPMFGIYFVAGAIFSGTGIVIVLIAILRKAYGLESYITPKHFLYLGYLLAAFAAIMIFFNVNEILVHAYKMKGHIGEHFISVFQGDLAPAFYFYLVGGLIVPILIILIPFTRRVPGIIAAAALANIGMVLERYVIVVGGLHVPLNPYEMPTYTPSWVELSLAAAGFAGFTLLIVLLLKLVPSVAVWEIEEEIEEGVQTSSRGSRTTGRAPAGGQS